MLGEALRASEERRRCPSQLIDKPYVVSRVVHEWRGAESPDRESADNRSSKDEGRRHVCKCRQACDGLGHDARDDDVVGRVAGCDERLPERDGPTCTSGARRKNLSATNRRDNLAGDHFSVDPERVKSSRRGIEAEYDADAASECSAYVRCDLLGDSIEPIVGGLARSSEVGPHVLPLARDFGHSLGVSYVARDLVGDALCTLQSPCVPCGATASSGVRDSLDMRLAAKPR